MTCFLYGIELKFIDEGISKAAISSNIYLQVNHLEGYIKERKTKTTLSIDFLVVDPVHFTKNSSSKTPSLSI